MDISLLNQEAIDKLVDFVFDKVDEELKQRQILLTEPKFISQKKLIDEYELAYNTLAKYEELGLKRSEPIEGGKIFYETADVIDFFRKYKKYRD
ncbi:MAG: hypothetical protein LKF42_08820 [Streptococcaceae bacterium]|jgi:hypothetical protein|nr:hypothetical protein [Streptococcaceae bacterium]MCH4177274.1 hypothetical protein [Streptococcaceae bacterium]